MLTDEHTASWNGFSSALTLNTLDAALSTDVCGLPTYFTHLKDRIFENATNADNRTGLLLIQTASRECDRLGERSRLVAYNGESC
jgi:hypothetical protein